MTAPAAALVLVGSDSNRCFDRLMVLRAERAAAYHRWIERVTALRVDTSAEAPQSPGLARTLAAVGIDATRWNVVADLQGSIAFAESLLGERRSVICGAITRREPMTIQEV